jgi:hypothetical protein
LCSKLLAPTQQLSTAEYIGWKKVMVAISVQKEMKGICEHGKLKVTTKVGHACLGGNGHQSSNIRRKQTALTSPSRTLHGKHVQSKDASQSTSTKRASRSTIFSGLASIMCYIPSHITYETMTRVCDEWRWFFLNLNTRCNCFIHQDFEYNIRVNG